MMNIIVVRGFRKLGQYGDPIFGYICPSMWGEYAKKNRQTVIVTDAPKVRYSQWLGLQERLVALKERTTASGIVIAKFVHLARGQDEVWINTCTHRRETFFVVDEMYGDVQVWQSIRRDWESSSVMNIASQNKSLWPHTRQQLYDESFSPM